jgi:ATP-dependent protease Clp ATPase subunit
MSANVENIILRLLNADYDVGAPSWHHAPDEIDKIARKTENVSITRDMPGEGVREARSRSLKDGFCNVPPQAPSIHSRDTSASTPRTSCSFAAALVGLEHHPRRLGKHMGFRPGEGIKAAAINREEMLRKASRKICSA